MKRIIKFRAWDGEKMMENPRFEFFNHGKNGPAVILVNECYGLEVMQFTGLTDKNGKEIYEGDMFQDEEDGSYNFVEWGTYYGGWSTNEWFTPKELVKEAGHLEVIGNIYENPELITPSP